MKQSLDSKDIHEGSSMSSESIVGKVTIELCRLLFKQLPYAIIAQLLVATIFLFGLSGYYQPETLVFWYGFLLSVSLYWTSVVAVYQFKQGLVSIKTWLFLYTIGTFLSGMAWGYVSLYLIPTETTPLQIYTIAIILGITAGAHPFFNPMKIVYYSFLIPAFLPLSIWFFLQGGTYFYLGLCSIIYIAVMLLSCSVANSSLRQSAKLRFQNIDLDSINRILEKRVADRTSELEKSLAITNSTLESTADGILVVDINGDIEYVNQKFMEIWQVPEEAIDSENHNFLKDLIIDTIDKAEEFISVVEHINQQPNVIDNGEIVFNDGRVFEWYSQPHVVRDVVNGRVWSFRDMSLRKKMEYQLAYQASHDTLTDLPNRALLFDRINKGMLYADRFHSNLIVMFVDIDNFKMINDHLGHDNGDIILKTIATRLQNCVRKSDTVARFGGDEFIVLFFANDKANILNMAHNLLDEVTKPILINSHEIVATTSIGVSIYPYDGTDSATLLKHADMAMYAAKNQGKNMIKLFDNTIRASAQKSLSYQVDLRNAVNKNQFILAYQPFVNLKSMEIIGCEALIRWQHPREGLLLPNQFIPIAEESGLINRIGSWVLEQACRQNLSWQAQGLKAISMSINISAVQFIRDDFLDFITTTIKKLRYPPELLEIELTESIIMENKKHTFDVLNELKKIGIGVSIDDFGTGYSSLNCLMQFPVTKLKIDQTFVLDCIDEGNEGSIVKAIVAMGHSLKIPVVAEGIEEKSHFKFLRHCKCELGQGFHLGKPMSPTEFAKLLRKESGSHIKAVK